MKLTAGQIADAMNAIMAIGNRPHTAIPMTAKYRLGRMHDTLLPLFCTIMDEQKNLVIKYGEEQFLDKEKTKSSGEWGIQDPEKMKLYQKEWTEYRATEFEVHITPIPFEMLGNEKNGLEVKEFVLLGPLVTEPKED